MQAMRLVRIAMLLAPLALSGCLYRAAWLPDGKHVAYLRNGALWITDLEGRHARIADAPAPDITLAPAPSHDLIALAGTFDGVRALKVVDQLGTLRWSISLPGTDASLLPGCWSPDATTILLTLSTRQVFVCDLETGNTTRLNTRGGPARFTPGSDLIWLAADSKGKWRLERNDRGIPVTEPKGDDAEPLRIADDMEKIWWRVRSAAGTRIVLAGPDGKPVFQSDRTFVAPGPDGNSYLTTDQGYALISAGSPARNLNAVYNRLLKMDLGWQLADPKTAAEPYDARELLAATPAFSPDGKRLAILTPHLLAISDLNSGEVLALAKW